MALVDIAGLQREHGPALRGPVLGPGDSHQAPAHRFKDTILNLDKFNPLILSFTPTHLTHIYLTTTCSFIFAWSL